MAFLRRSASLSVMKATGRLHNRIVAAVLPVFFAFAAQAQTAKLDELMSRLKDADESSALRFEREILLEWSKSGSPAMDLLLQRGKDALDAAQPQIAIEHLTALVDHDPDFAEGWHTRASAWLAIGKLGPAVDDLSHALTLNPRHFGALASLGMVFEELDKPEKAVEAYNAALELNPQMADVKDAVKRIEADLAGQDI